jgi:hypothetical protein
MKVALLSVALVAALTWVGLERYDKSLYIHEVNVAEYAVRNRIVEVEELKGQIADLELELEIARMGKRVKRKH